MFDIFHVPIEIILITYTYPCSCPMSCLLTSTNRELIGLEHTENIRNIQFTEYMYQNLETIDSSVVKCKPNPLTANLIFF